MLITIIIPVYNTVNYLEECLNSVINQTYKKLEIILINDGSTDGSEKICKKFTDKDNRIKLINKENEGVSKASNIGLKLATGEYIYLMDSDDYIDLNTIEIFVKNIINFEYPDIVKTTRKNLIISNEKKISHVENDLLNKKINIQDNLEKILDFSYKSCPLWLGIYKTNIIKKLTFDETIKKANYQDALITIELCFNSNTIVLIDNIFYHYRINGNSTQNTFNLKNNINFLNSISVLDKYYEKLNLNIKKKFIMFKFKTVNYLINITNNKLERQQIIKQIFEYLKININSNFDLIDNYSSFLKTYIEYNNIYKNQIFFKDKQPIEILLKINNDDKIQNLVLYYSLLKNSKNNINFNILIPNDFETNLINIYELLKNKYNNHNILQHNLHFIKINDQIDFIIYLPFIFPKINKILYLRSNLIIKKDLYKLYNNFINENQIIGKIKNNDDLMILNLYNLKKNNISFKYEFNKNFVENKTENLRTILNENEIEYLNFDLTKYIFTLNENIFDIEFNDKNKTWFKYLTKVSYEIFNLK